MWSTSSSSATTAKSGGTHADTHEEQPRDDVGLDCNPDCSSRYSYGLSLEQRIYPTPLNDTEEASYVAAGCAASIGKKDKIVFERPVVRVRPYVPDIADAPAPERTKISVLDESTESTMPPLSGSVSRLRNMFETMSSPEKNITVSSLSLDKSGDLPTLKVKEIAAKFGIPDYGSPTKTSDDASCITEREFTGQFDSRHNDVMIYKQEEEISKFSNRNLRVIPDAVPEIPATAQTFTGKKESWLPGKPIEIKPTIPTYDSSVPTKTLSSDQMLGNTELCDDLRFDSEFLYENDRITQESLKRSSEPEVIQRGTLRTQFLFGWVEENERQKKDMNDDDPKNVQISVEAYGETSEITLNNDIMCKSVEINKMKDREIDKYESNTVKNNFPKVPIPCPTKSLLSESSKTHESGFENKCSDTPEEIFISANFETEHGSESDYNIPLKKSVKLEPDIIHGQEAYLTKENDQKILNEETDNRFASDGAPESVVSNPDEVVETSQETLITPVMVSAVPICQIAGPGEEHPPIVYKNLNDAICDILGDVNRETNAPQVLHEETRKANCDDSHIKQMNLEQAVIDSSSIVAVDDPKLSGNISFTTECNPQDVVQSGTQVGNGNGCQTLELQITQSSTDKHISGDISLASEIDPVSIVSKKHPDVAEYHGENDKSEDPHHSGLKSGGEADSDDSDTVAEKEEMATQNSLMEMYETLLTGSARHGSSHEEYESESDETDNSSSGTESGSDTEDDGVFSGTLLPDDPATIRERRASLTHTLRENLCTLTSNEFHNLMASYRDPTSPVNKFGETITLDGTLKSQLDDWQSRQLSVDEQSEPSQSHRSSETDTSQTSPNDLSGTYTVNEPRGSSLINNDTFTQTHAILKDISYMDKVFTETTVQAGSAVPGDGVKELLQRHLAEVDVLSKIRANEKDRLQQKLNDKLAQKEKYKQKVSISDEEEFQMEELQLAVVNKLDRKLSADLDELNQKCVKKLDTLQKGELNQEMLQTLLTEHRTQQAELIAQRLAERNKQNQLLTKRLEQGQRLLQATREKEEARSLTSTASGLHSTTDTVDIDMRISVIDDEFYNNLMDRQKRESIAEEELENLVEEHLDKVEQFRSKLQEMLKRKRKERREEMKRKRKNNKKGQDKADLSVTGLIRERDEVDRQVQDVRQQHREKSDFKLQQILQSKQKKKESTNLSETIKSSPLKSRQPSPGKTYDRNIHSKLKKAIKILDSHLESNEQQNDNADML